MKIVLEKKVFLNLIQNAMGHIVQKKSTIPIIEGILLRVPASNTIEVCSTDLEIFLRQKMTAETEGDTVGKGWVIDGKFFQNLLSKIEAEVVMLEILQTTVKIVVGKNNYSSPFQLEKDFPIPPDLGTPIKKLTYDTAILRNYFNKCLPFATIDELRPVLAGIHYSQKDKQVHIEAADMFRMVHAIDTTESEEEIDIVIPSKFAETYTKIYLEEKSVMQTDDKYIRIEGEKFMLHARLVDFKYPNTQPLFAQEHPHELKIKKETIINALKRLMIVNSTSKITRWDIGAERLKLRAENMDLGMQGEEIFEDFKCKGAPIEAGFNPEYITIALNAFRSEDVVIHYASADKAVLITDDKKAVKTLVMPLMINS